MRLLYFSSLLFAAHFGAQAQDMPPAAPAISVVPAAGLAAPALRLIDRAGHQDTVTAVYNLFARRRKGGHTWGAIGLGGGLALARILAGSGGSSANNASYGPATSTEVNGGAVILVAGVFVGIPAVLGLTKLSSFGETKEQAVISAYNSTGQLPANVLRKLSAKDFARK